MFLLYARKISVALLFVLATTYSSFGQVCVIDTNNFELISPASEYLPCIERGVPYSATIQIFAIPSIAFSVDSYLITTFLNLPSGITYSMNPMPCKLYPNNRGCVYLSGTTNDTAGFYIIDYNGFAYLQQGNPSFDYIRNLQPGALPEVSLKVIEQGTPCSNTPNGIKNVTANAETAFSVYPNPTSGVFELKINSDNYRHAEIKVTDATGRTVYSQQTDNSLSGTVRIDLTSFPKGLYLVQLRNAEGAVSKNISVE